MSADVKHLLRIESMRGGLEHVNKEITRWLLRCRQADAAGRHKTQIDAIGSTLVGALEGLAEALNTLQSRLPLPAADLYADLRDHEQALLWLQRLWRFFADKLDQHLPDPDDASLRSLMQSADEVIWSCHQPVLVKLARKGAAPVAYVAHEYSPAALDAHRPLPMDLRLNAEIPGLEEFLTGLPVSLLRLPASCRQAPWWLVYIGHETGHHIQWELDLVKHTCDGLAAAAQAAGVSAAAVARWEQWGEEIFADIYSLLTMGQWALWALAEAQWGGRDAMLKPKPRYPAAAVRLKLMSEAAGKLAVPKVELPGSLDDVLGAPLPSSITEDLAVVPFAIEFLLGPMQGERTLAQIVSFNAAHFGAHGEVAKWASALSANGPLPALNRTLQSPRLIASATLQAWTHLVDIKDAKLRTQMSRQLADRALSVLPGSGPPGVRSGTVDVPQLGGELLRRLFDASKKRRGGAVGADAVSG